MGAMTSLNLSRNGLEAEGAKHIAGALKASECMCPCDHFGTTLMSI
jgi:hypothetical protein